MTPLIIESNDPNTITEYLASKYYLQNLVYEVTPEDNSIGLPAIKYLLDRAKFTSAEKSQQVFLIRSADLITPAGQNALLKCLEESRPSEQFILTTHNHYLLLATIVSRCQVIKLASQIQTQTDQDYLKQFISFLDSPARGLLGTDQIMTQNPKEYLRGLIEQLHQACQQFPTDKRAKILCLALQCHTDLIGNVNPKLAIDHFLLESLL